MYLCIAKMMIMVQRILHNGLNIHIDIISILLLLRRNGK